MNERDPTRPLFLLYVATTKVGDALAAALRGTSFTVEEAVVLNQIDVLEPVTPSALAARLGIAPSALSYRLRALELRRLVVRRPNPADGRSTLLRLSARGRGRWERVRPRWLGAVRAIEDALDVPIDEVVGALRALASAADQVQAELPARATSS